MTSKSMYLLQNLNPPKQTDYAGQDNAYKILPGQQAVVSGIVVILELEHVQLRIVILTSLQERMEI